MTSAQSPRLHRSDFPAARSLFRSIFMEGWNETYPTWQYALQGGFYVWGFTHQKCLEIVAELDQLLTYPDSALRDWLPKICSGLPTGRPDAHLTTRNFIVLLRDEVMPAMEAKAARRRHRAAP